MAMKKLSVLAIVPLLLLAGCSAFFDFNAYSALDTVAAPSVTKYEGSGGLAALATDLSSPAVVKALTADSATTAAIEQYLLTNYLSGALTSPDQKQAAVLYADLNLKTTQGENFVNNIVTTVMSGVPVSSTIQDILASIIPASAKADPVVFAAMITALRNSNTQYLKLAGGIDVNSNQKLDSGEGAPANMNIGDVAQKSAVAYTVEDIFQMMSTALGGPSTVMDQMYLLATNPSAANSLVTNLHPQPYTTPSTDLYVTTNLWAIQLLFDCAGLTLP